MSALEAKLQLSIAEPFVFLSKPAGIPSHAPDKGSTGLVEEVSRLLQRPLFSAPPKKLCDRRRYGTGA